MSRVLALQAIYIEGPSVKLKWGFPPNEVPGRKPKAHLNQVGYLVGTYIL
jgi:hypothetical protein